MGRFQLQRVCHPRKYVIYLYRLASALLQAERGAIENLPYSGLDVPLHQFNNRSDMLPPSSRRGGHLQDLILPIVYNPSSKLGARVPHLAYSDADNLLCSHEDPFRVYQ